MGSDDEKKRILEELRNRKEKIMKMGGEESIEKQHKKGKLTARERINILLDEGSFNEIGSFVKHRCKELGMEERKLPGDGVVTGYGEIDGRKVYVFSQDFTCMGGTSGEMHAEKIVNTISKAREDRCPLVGIHDSAGARIHETVDAFTSGEIFYQNSISSGEIPQISAIVGPCAGAAVYSPALMDFIFMVEDISYAFITGPGVIKQVTGEEISSKDLGSSKSQQEKSGVVHRNEKDEKSCYANIRRLLSYLPSNCSEAPPRHDAKDDPNHVNDNPFDVLPSNPNKPYDMYKIIEKVFDKGENDKNYFDIKPSFAKNIITCFARLNGRSVGIIANQPNAKAGTLDIDSSEKAARFIRFCDAFNISLINLVDVPGYMPGKKQEWGGIIRRGAKMLYAYSTANVPILTLVIRKSYGGALQAMGSKFLGADRVLAWPSAEIAIMGYKGAVPIIYKKEISDAENKEEMREKKVAEYKEKYLNSYKAAEHYIIDEIIEPAKTRQRLINELEILIANRKIDFEKKHGVPPD